MLLFNAAPSFSYEPALLHRPLYYSLISNFTSSPPLPSLVLPPPPLLLLPPPHYLHNMALSSNYVLIILSSELRDALYIHPTSGDRPPPPLLHRAAAIREIARVGGGDVHAVHYKQVSVYNIQGVPGYERGQCYTQRSHPGSVSRTYFPGNALMRNRFLVYLQDK